MKRPLSHRLIFKSLLLALSIMGVQCGKKDESASSAPQPAPQKAPAPTRPPSLTDHADKLGFAGMLPAQTEFYLGSVNLKKHVAALKESAWWKDISGLVQDKTPAPTAGDKTLATLEKLWGDDFFLAGGQGFAASAAQLRAMNRVYNEVYFKMLMAGPAASALGGTPKDGAKPNPLLYLQMFLQDPATLEKVAGVLAALELPPLLAGVKVEKPEEILALLSDTKELEEKKVFVMSDLVTPQGQKFRVATVALANLFPEADQESALSKLPSDTPAASRAIIEKAYTDLRKKKFLLAWGSVNGHVILACGQNLDHLKFAASPEQSLLARPELGSLLPDAGKNLAALTYMSAASLNAINDDQPVVPMLRGVVSAMKENPMFKGLGEALDKQITELGPIESKVYASEATDFVGAAWWDRGLHAESTGGIKPKFLLPGKPLHFQQLVDRPGVIFGLAYHRNQEHEKLVRDWMERLIGIAYTAAQELVKAGIAGPQGGQSFAMFNIALLPTIQGIYRADKDMDEKGLGSEVAYILDVNGKMPELPGVPSAAKDMKFPRLTSVSEVASRAELAKGWKTVNETITEVAAIAAPFLGQPAADGKPPFVVPQPESLQSGDTTTWFYTGDFLSGDLSPAAAISDKLLILSSSKEAAQSFAADLAKPPGTPLEGALWKLDVGAAADWFGKASALSPSTTAEQAKELQQTLKWFKPFHAMQGRMAQEKGQWRFNLDWEITDVVKFD
jgi:hypothetical protein